MRTRGFDRLKVDVSDLLTLKVYAKTESESVYGLILHHIYIATKMNRRLITHHKTTMTV